MDSAGNKHLIFSWNLPIVPASLDVLMPTVCRQGTKQLEKKHADPALIKNQLN